jgi:hypothetical protein
MTSVDIPRRTPYSIAFLEQVRLLWSRLHETRIQILFSP